MCFLLPICTELFGPFSLGLASESIAQGELLWKVRPKYHKFLGSHICTQYTPSLHDELLAHCAISLRLDHICYDTAQTASPLRLSCYIDEDAMGQIKRLAREANPLRLDVQVLERYSAYCCCRGCGN